MEFPAGRKGIVVGEHPALRIEIQGSDSEGYFIIQSRDGQSEVFDDWVESRSALDRYFELSGWNILWDEQ